MRDRRVVASYDSPAIKQAIGLSSIHACRDAMTTVHRHYTRETYAICVAHNNRGATGKLERRPPKRRVVVYHEDTRGCVSVDESASVLAPMPASYSADIRVISLC